MIGIALETTLFAADRPWLASQFPNGDWDRVCERLHEQLCRWLTEYTESLCRAVPAEDGVAASYRQSLWECWGYHWRQAAGAGLTIVDGWEAAVRIRAGNASVGRGQLGGDVLRDVILARAVARREENATRLFHGEYFDFLLKQMAGSQANAATCEDWGGELMDRLAGYTRPPGKLNLFQGKCALRPWLRVVARNFARNHLAHCVSHSALPVNLVGAPNLDGETDRECLALFRRLLREGLTQLQPSDRTMLLLLYGEGVAGKQVAQILGVDPGTLSRRKDRAIRHLAQTLDQRETDPESRRGVTECLQHLLGSGERLEFAQMILELIEDPSA